MTWKPSEEELKKLDEVEKWMYMNEDGDWLLRDDTPKELKDFHEKMKNKYSQFN